MAGAQAVGSTAWLVAHLLAIVSFILLGLGLLFLRDLARDRPGAGAATAACVLGLVGAGLVLPYYGAEVFGLHAIAGRALADGGTALLPLFDTVRYHPAAATLFVAGLLALAAAGVAAFLALSRSGLTARWVPVPLAAGLVLVLPQFFGPPSLRIAHGVLIGVGALLVAFALVRPRVPAAA